MTRSLTETHGMRRRNFLLAGLAATLCPAVWSVERIDPDPAAVELLNSLLKALMLEDEGQRLAAVLPLVHKSLITRDGKDLERSVKDFSYKKASAGARLYAFPVEITEVHKGNSLTIGFKETAETGRVDKYFLAKRSGVAGRPAPIHVFWDSQGKPKVTNMGSL